ncbi:hypothetical protein DSO57_1018327 [Entomophthora muscae]|uniref:Uncharacterized protein n=1 Tax=Entomophthora muscae TaxID=34485 RepID=A0ACC2RVQ0_9FUNG|nr:hypothetical protein DSO57_1018327 [Entomophthora muscae]
MFILLFLGLEAIDNSFPPKTQAQEQDSNPGPGFLQAAGPMDCWAACLCFLGIKPLQAEAPINSQSQNTDTSPTIVAPKEELSNYLMKAEMASMQAS